MSKKIVKRTPKGKWSIKVGKFEANAIMYLLQEILVTLNNREIKEEDFLDLKHIAEIEELMQKTDLYECREGNKERLTLKTHEAILLYGLLYTSARDMDYLWGIRDALHQQIISLVKPIHHNLLNI